MERKDKKDRTISELESQAGDEQTGTSGESRTDPTEDIQQALTAKAEEAQALQDKLLRLAAEFENYKRISQREQRDQTKFANESLLKDLLPTLDNLERAIGFSKEMPASDGLVQGVELTLKHLLETLSKFGVRQIASVGEHFDPTRHQAVAHVPSKDATENTVLEEYQKGYQLHDRVIRPAMVSVAASATSESGDNLEP